MLQSADHDSDQHDGEAGQNDGEAGDGDGEAGDECFCPSWKVLGVWGKRSWGEARHCIVPRPTYINSFTAYMYTSKVPHKHKLYLFQYQHFSWVMYSSTP